LVLFYCQYCNAFFIVCTNGPFSGGWTAYPPLSALGQASPGSKVGMDLWLVSMALFVVSALLGGLNYIATVEHAYKRYEHDTFASYHLGILLYCCIRCIIIPCFIFSGFILLIFDRHFGTSFYLSDIYIGGQAYQMKVEVPFFISTCSGSSVTLKCISFSYLPWVW
jgi:cytochrome c oxidase subunit I